MPFPSNTLLPAGETLPSALLDLPFFRARALGSGGPGATTPPHSGSAVIAAPLLHSSIAPHALMATIANEAVSASIAVRSSQAVITTHTIRGN